MTKITFEDLPSTNTPLNASNLNTMQDNIENAIPTIDNAVSTSSTNPVENQAITNYVNNKSLDIYTTTEQRVGTWIDGKPLYKISIQDTLGTSNGVWKDVQILPANYVKYATKIEGIFQPNNGSFYVIPFFRGTDNNYTNREYVLCNYQPSLGTIAIVAYHASSYATVYANKPFWYTLYYTKISDYS